MPLTYATDCRLGFYDLADQLLEIYSTNKATYQKKSIILKKLLISKSKQLINIMG